MQHIMQLVSPFGSSLLFASLSIFSALGISSSSSTGSLATLPFLHMHISFCMQLHFLTSSTEEV